MRFVKSLDLLVVVEGTAILKIYSAGPHKIGQIEPAIAMRKLMIDSKRSARAAAPKDNSRGGGGPARGEGAPATNVGTEVGKCEVNSGWPPTFKVSLSSSAGVFSTHYFGVQHVLAYVQRAPIDVCLEVFLLLESVDFLVQASIVSLT